MLSSMDQRVATLQFDGCAEKDRLRGYNLFGSMPWRLRPWHKQLPGLAQKIHGSIFTSLFSTKVIYAGLPRKAFPRK